MPESFEKKAKWLLDQCVLGEPSVTEKFLKMTLTGRSCGVGRILKHSAEVIKMKMGAANR